MSSELTVLTMGDSLQKKRRPKRLNTSCSHSISDELSMSAFSAFQTEVGAVAQRRVRSHDDFDAGWGQCLAAIREIAGKDSAIRSERHTTTSTPEGKWSNGSTAGVGSSCRSAIVAATVRELYLSTNSLTSPSRNGSSNGCSRK